MGVKIRKLLLYLLFLFVTISYASANLIINEIMANPPGIIQSDEKLNEYIELYNNGSNKINVSGWKIGDKVQNDSLIGGYYGGGGTIIEAGEYALITAGTTRVYNNFNVLDCVRLYTEDKSIGAGLNDGEETVYLYDNNMNLIDSFAYTSTTEDLSWNRIGSSWIEDEPTPGGKGSVSEEVIENNACDWQIKINSDKSFFEDSSEVEWGVEVYRLEGSKVNLSVTGYVKKVNGQIIKEYHPWTNTTVTLKRTTTYNPNLEGNEVYLLEYNITHLSCDDSDLSNNYFSRLIAVGLQLPEPQNENISYDMLRINEFLPNPAGYDDAPMPGGEWVELYNSGNESIDVKGLILNDDFGNGLEITEVNVADNTIIDPGGLLVIYRNGNGRLELNNNGLDQVVLSYQGAVIDSVSYSDAAEGNSYAYVEGVGWQHTKPTPNEENVNYNDVKDSHFEIGSISDLGSDNETEFGDIIKVNFHVYKGDTTKSSIKLYIENDEDRITKITKAMLHNKYTDYTLTLPIPIKSNCNEKYANDDYYVKIGWTSYSKEEDSFKLRVDGINMNNCDKIYVERKPRKGTLTNQLVESPKTVELNKDFTVKIELTNNDGNDHIVDIYSYVYRGSKSYSGEREANKKSVLVKAGQTKEFELKNVVTQAEPGDYKIKIKVKRDDQKTEKEITQAIKVLQKKEETKETEEKIELKEKDKEDYYAILESTKQPKTIYLSTSEKAKGLVVKFFIGLLVVYAGILTWKR